MYDVHWDIETGGILLKDTRNEGIRGEVRPVFYEELEILGFNEQWRYLRADEPYLWAVGGRKYFYRGELVAEAVGGGLFSRPEVKYYRTGLELRPVDITAMLAKNGQMLEGMAQQAIKFIYNTYRRYRKKTDVTAVAFSGGKDSLVMLDLVQRALAPDEFVVVFGDTTMEIDATYEAVDKARRRWPHLGFYTARSSRDALTLWREMGPPSRIHRWCCAVHKSAPTLLLLRELAQKPAVRALIFDGVRHEESASRAGYLAVTDGGKHRMQTNASPIIDWNSGEVYLYLFSRRLMLNQAYRYGIMRVGCAVCPMASRWWDMISSCVYEKEMISFIEILRQYALGSGVPPGQVDRYLLEGGWKGRAGGRYLAAGGNRVIENREGEKVKYTLRHPEEDWRAWARAIGPLVLTGEDRGYIERGEGLYPYRIARLNSSVVVELEKIRQADRFLISELRAVAAKAAYCRHCRACEVECPTGALNTSGKVEIDDERCIACGQCLHLRGKVCLAAKSLMVSGGDVVATDGNRAGLHSYQHFGMRKEWLAEFLRSPDKWAAGNSLGNRQFEAMVMWLKHAEIIGGDRKSGWEPTVFGERLRSLGADSLLTWAAVWTNLARNSTPVQWYVSNIPWLTPATKKELVEKLGEQYPLSASTRENSMTALTALLTKTPLGNELGLGVHTGPGRRTGGTLYKRGWAEPHPLAVLYSLYRYAERVGRYELTVSELYGQAPEGPYALFGIDREKLILILQGLSSLGTGWIKTDLVRDLDNIFLDRSRRACEVLQLD
ncbi:MAG TPA: phosphoadenosine phosphosulfate reductase family protein [Bacillota bacterium]|nr:phosphoadenosine phosphosulfate reductase family protein [Bacillota bacterium]